ncbi:MAG: ankyrin repeat domain-containing protein [Ignavibacteria bacterium]|nr:ankyrin repeat domain-containing protein [Ignavibacteria bacterium]
MAAASGEQVWIELTNHVETNKKKSSLGKLIDKEKLEADKTFGELCFEFNRLDQVSREELSLRSRASEVVVEAPVAKSVQEVTTPNWDAVWDLVASNDEYNTLNKLREMGVVNLTKEKPFVKSEQNLLHLAAEKGMFELVEFLIARQAPVHAPDALGELPVHRAVSNRSKAILSETAMKNSAKVLKRILVADPSLASAILISENDYNGFTPLHFAVLHGNTVIIFSFSFVFLFSFSDFFISRNMYS